MNNKVILLSFLMLFIFVLSCTNYEDANLIFSYEVFEKDTALIGHWEDVSGKANFYFDRGYRFEYRDLYVCHGVWYVKHDKIHLKYSKFEYTNNGSVYVAIDELDSLNYNFENNLLNLKFCNTSSWWVLRKIQ